MDLTEGSETMAIINQTPGNYPKESLLHSTEHFAIVCSLHQFLSKFLFHSSQTVKLVDCVTN